ncbi:hypothetical protein GGU10DRAFT_86435 [Lentinula aff. detonsa]|uniref:Uncharacterized protein n=1 Tax=Lentinula aff. detonsa TaxID=2804958 RepID=A0AA38L3R9_9AGAR|nr:hypothetical protein GGU10DRAFT_86435 [Lentinula aff. detonsa]
MGCFSPRSACLCLYGFILAPSYSGHLDRRFYWSECCSAFKAPPVCCLRAEAGSGNANKMSEYIAAKPTCPGESNEKSADMEIVTGLWRLVSTRPVKFHILYWGSN